jgi:Rps23 Pro-64 3,4-dihydroxylase Tpa1-like proline 4-hydroxylase
MVQRYIQNEGKYVYHNDFHIDKKNNMYRQLTYVFYLNDVIEGGETEFFNGEISIKPQCGKLIIFPSSWTFPHCGKMPISSNKYIITGWMYNEHV